MLSFIVDRFELKSRIWDVASSFYAKDFDVESTFCIPFTVSRDGPIAGKQFPKVGKLYNLRTL
jgi:hypothetical protein